MATEDVQTNLRLPADLKNRLVLSAAENNRSLSAEVASRLEGSYAPGESYATQSQLERVFARISSEHNNTLMAIGTIRDLLANFVVKLYDLIPAKDRSSPEVVLMKSFADASKSRDIAEIQKGFLPIFEDVVNDQRTPDTAAQVATVFAKANLSVSDAQRRVLNLDTDPLVPKD